MRNLFLLSTSKQGAITLNYQWNTWWITTDHIIREVERNVEKLKYHNIYIISDEDIKAGDWCLDLLHYSICIRTLDNYKSQFKKIILTTDKDLIKVGVQPIEEEFLNWFIKNPTCNYVKTEKMLQTRWGTEWIDLPNQKEGRENDGIYRFIFKLIYPNEECICERPDDNVCDYCDEQESKKILQEAKNKANKIETIEDGYNKVFNGKVDRVLKAGFIAGAKWKEENTTNHLNSFIEQFKENGNLQELSNKDWSVSEFLEWLKLNNFKIIKDE